MVENYRNKITEKFVDNLPTSTGKLPTNSDKWISLQGQPY